MAQRGCLKLSVGDVSKPCILVEATPVFSSSDEYSLGSEIKLQRVELIPAIGDQKPSPDKTGLHLCVFVFPSFFCVNPRYILF